MKKVAIVTAASKGIGAACARKFAESGYKLVIMARSEAIFDLADELDARPIQGSVGKVSDLQRLVDLAHEKYGRVDTVICNTGHPPKGELLKLQDADWETGMNLVLMNVIRLARMVTPFMQESGSGSFVNISTFGAKEPSAAFPVSSVMRTALGSFTKLYATEFGRFNIRMNSILPGFIDSYPATDETIKTIPLFRQGTPEEVAELALFLASGKSSYITGQNFLIDGGLTKSI